MAAYSAPLFSRISQAGDSRLEHYALPQGACNYRDLSAGTRAKICGCTRFWLNDAGPANSSNERAWCFCGHHACFHEHEISSAPTRMAQVEAQASGQRFEHTTGVNDSQRSPEAPVKLHNNSTSPTFNASSVFRNLSQAGLGIQNPTPSRPQSIDTRLWIALNQFAREQDHTPHSDSNSKLPSTAVPSLIDEHLNHSHNGSQERYSSNRIMGPPINLSALNNAQPDERNEAYSATEVATPSLAGTPDPGAFVVPGAANSISPGHLNPAIPRIDHGQLLPTVSAAPHYKHTHPSSIPQSSSTEDEVRMTLHEMYNKLQNQSRRIEVLESLSFSQVRNEDLQEKLDILDGRILDLEHWRVERDKALVDEEEEQKEALRSRAESRRHLSFDTNSFSSDLSDSKAAAQTETVILATLAANAETHPRIDALESRILDLEHAAAPCHARPWHVQVILIPFGRQLPGLWSSTRESTWRLPRSAEQSEEWTGLQSSAKSSFQSTTSTAWTTESIQAWARDTQGEWFSPKACAPSSTAFQRLASRGFVQDIELVASDAAHILSRVTNALGDLLDDEEKISPSLSERFRGLQERFIPLRKVRKSSRLRFLSPAEMVTPATWTAEFLASSVMMKPQDGYRRLYLTTPNAYTQPLWTEWTWASLKDLPRRVSTDSRSADRMHSGDYVNNDLEACWTRSIRLDRPSSLRTSLASHEALDPESAGLETSLPLHSQATSPFSANAGDLSPPPHTRSVSLPSSTSIIRTSLSTEPIASGIVLKRRVASLETASTGPRRGNLPVALDDPIYKRRRVSSSSPELERRPGTALFTPRWSREPPSPGVASAARSQPPGPGAGRMLRASSAQSSAGSFALGTTVNAGGMGTGAGIGASGSGIGASSKRGITPLAYATPHSHLDSRLGEGEGEAEDVEMDLTGSSSLADLRPGLPLVRRGDEVEEDGGDELEEWEGVQEGTATEVMLDDEDDDRREERSGEEEAEDEDDDDDDDDEDDDDDVLFGY